MNKYESVIIADPKCTDENIKTLEEKITELISKDGKVISFVNKGKTKLAYCIKKNHEGIYIVIEFEANPELISSIERYYRFTDEILKFIITKIDKDKN